MQTRSNKTKALNKLQLYTIVFAVFMNTAVIHLTMLHVFFNREQISKTLLGQAFHYILRLFC
jgi:hypothetical protein